jgi:HK97 family phage portal protein
VLTLPGPYVYDATSARRIPAVGLALQLFSGLCKQMPIDAWRGPQALPRPRLLSRPDPDRARSWFVHVSIEDYLLNGNCITYVTSRGADGWPTTVTWLPASWVYIVWDSYSDEQDVTYYYVGSPLNFDDVIHVRRGADRMYPVRGVGVVEEYLSTLDRVAMEEVYERNTLAGAAVPSVAVITPQAMLNTDVAQEAKQRWIDTLSGPVREPVILPNGTQVIPLAWSPSDTQLIEARKLSLLDVANIFNLDGYWLGSPVSGMTYKTAGPQYQQVLRTSLEPVLADFEDVWSDAWLPRGSFIRFDRNQLLRDDLQTTAMALSTLVGANIITAAQAQAYLGLPVMSGDVSTPVAAPQVSIGSQEQPQSGELEEGEGEGEEEE